MIDEAVKEWRASGEHLPKFFRDFHDQKALMGAMHYFTRKEECKELEAINLVNGHVYIVDVFLHFMARHGYTLQKTRKNLPFEDIEENISQYLDMTRNQFYNLISGEKNDDKQS